MLLLIAGVLLALLVAAVFVPYKDCWCLGSLMMHRREDFRCETCNNSGKASIFQLWKFRRTMSGGLIFR